MTQLRNNEEQKMSKDLQLLKRLVSANRWETISKVVRSRTRHVVVVLENVIDKGNVNAVLRSADAFGFQDVHLICSDQQNTGKRKANRQNESLRPHRTDAGARKWLTIHEWDSTKACLGNLALRGYCVAIASPSAPCSVANLSLERKLAVVFGNEHSGLSSEGLEAADLSFCLPMYGFVESLNVSVAAAITMYELRRRIICEHTLPCHEQEDLLAEMVGVSIGHKVPTS